MKTLIITIILSIINLQVYATTLKVGFIPKGSSDSYWDAMQVGAISAAKKLNIDLVWRGPRTEDGIDAQVKILEYFKHEGVNGIILAPNSTTKLLQKIIELQKIGIKIIIADSPLDSTFTYVGTNNYKAGEKIGNELVSKFPKIKKLLIYRYSKEHSSTTERENGFLNIVKNKLPKIKIIDNYYSGISPGEAEHNLIDILSKENNIDLIFTPNDSGTEGTIQALKTLGKNKIIRHMGFDSSKTIKFALESKDLDSTLIQNPVLIGYQSVKIMGDILNSKKVPSIIETPTIIVNKMNMKDKEIFKLIN